ncbi:hypothetical protein [Methylomonas sp. LL1]|uniref:hypothetical protein n=1 Tax=Methylomonas sp. LL1 TaxID=2785785 RepID=UPI001E503266|nr:hypothetical protein [Methylomonas sp. LL1]
MATNVPSPNHLPLTELSPDSTTAVTRSAKQACQTGFTLIELVMIIVMLGILSATAMPRFFDLSIFQQRGFFDDTLNAMRYAQKLAVATGCNVQLSIAANQYQLKRPGASNRSLCESTSATDFTLEVIRPGSGEASYQGNQSGVAVSDATLYFLANGSASTGATITVGGRQITVVQNTGFVYDSTP